MLKVETYLSKSTIEGAGIGCFSKQFIPKGTVIWEFNSQLDRTFSDEDIKNMDSITRKFVETYSYRLRGIYYLCVDNGRFFNHSDNPNTLDPIEGNKTYALRDINPGEEILSDYKSFGETEEDIKFNTTL